MAIINTESLPLRYKYNFGHININPFTYKTLLDYLEGLPKSDNEVFMYDLFWLMKDDANARQLLLPDAEYLVFLKKAISIDSNLVFKAEVKCPECGTKNILVVKGTELQFTRPTDEIIYQGLWMELTSGTYLCKLPTVDKFLKVIEVINTYGVTRHLELIKSIAMINEHELNPMQVENSILNATSDDIVTIVTVYDLLYKSLLPVELKCKNKDCSCNERGMSVEINSLIGNVFRTLLLSRSVDKDKIYIK